MSGSGASSLLRKTGRGWRVAIITGMLLHCSWKTIRIRLQFLRSLLSYFSSASLCSFSWLTITPLSQLLFSPAEETTTTASLSQAFFSSNSTLTRVFASTFHLSLTSQGMASRISFEAHVFYYFTSNVNSMSCATSIWGQLPVLDCLISVH